MDNSHSGSSLFGKLSKLRRRPPQPLTDLAELYSRIANESIYYKKLEERKNYKHALQGWKALTTDAMFQLTVIERSYPHLQNYTEDELSLLNGVRELQHKGQAKLEQLQDFVNSNPDEYSHSNINNNIQLATNKYHTRDHKAKLITRPTMTQQITHGFSKTTLRSDIGNNYYRPRNDSLHSESNSHSLSSDHHVKVNFSRSKPLHPTEEQEFRDFSDTSKIEEDSPVFIDLTDDHYEVDLNPDPFAEGEEYERTDANITNESSPKFDDHSNSSTSDQFDFDDYYDDYMEASEEKSSKDIESARHDTLDILNGNDLSKSLSTLSMDSTPLVPVCPPPPPPPNIPKMPPIPKAPLLIPNKKSSNPNKLKATKSTPTLLHKQPIIKPKLKSSSSTSSPLPSLTKTSTGSKPRIKHKENILPKGINGPASYAAQLVYNKKSSSSDSFQKQNLKNLPKSTPSVPKKKIPSKQKINKSMPPTAKTAKASKVAVAPKLKQKTTKPKTVTREKKTLTSSSSSSIAKNNNDDNKLESDKNIKDTKEILEDKIIDSIPGIDKMAAKQIFQEIVVHGDEVHWNDIAGLETAKYSLKEAVVYPFLRPDLFMGLREPVRGMLLFGPPGTGKTMLARAVACESKSTFFSISASSLTSKYLGESEKLVRALFGVARKMSPSIIFVDEIDSILGSRSNENENESSRRIKNEFLIQWSSLSSAAAGNEKNSKEGEEDSRVLVLAATNLPWSIDEAARRRFVRRQYIPLPEDETRLIHLKKLLSRQNHKIDDEGFKKLIELTQGYSGSDITSLAKDAAMGPLRELGDDLLEMDMENIRSIELKDFENSLKYIKPSVSQEGLMKYEEWAEQFGSSGS